MFALLGALVQATEPTLNESTSIYLPVRDGPVRFYDRQGAIGPQTHDAHTTGQEPIHPCEPYTHSLSAHSSGAHLLLSREPSLSGPLPLQAFPVLPEAPRPTCVVEEDIGDMLSSSSTCLRMQEELFGPIFPIMIVTTPQEAVKFINSRPKPLRFKFSSQQTKKSFSFF